MFYNYIYPYYRYSPVPYMPYYGGAGWGYPGYANYGSNIIGSSIANNELINTGTATDISQIANPINFW
jgi:hypothetical protein